MNDSIECGCNLWGNINLFLICDIKEDSLGYFPVTDASSVF